MFNHLKNSAQKLDLFFLFMLAVAYIFSYIVRYVPGDSDTFFIVMLNIFFLLIVICYFSNVVTSLISCLIFVFGYGSYILYEAIIAQKSVQTASYIWLAVIPVGCIVTAFYRTYLADVQERITKLDSTVGTLSGFDENTGMLNERMFYHELGRYMAMALRGYIKMTLVLVKIKYYDDILRIVGTEGIGDIFKAVGDAIGKFTRVEDAQYFVDEKGVFSIIAITDKAGAEIIKERLKDNMKDIELEQRLYRYDLSMELKIGIAEFTPEVKSAPEFRQLALKNMEYDV